MQNSFEPTLKRKPTRERFYSSMNYEQFYSLYGPPSPLFKPLEDPQEEIPLFDLEQQPAIPQNIPVEAKPMETIPEVDGSQNFTLNLQRSPKMELLWGRGALIQAPKRVRVRMRSQSDSSEGFIKSKHTSIQWPQKEKAIIVNSQFYLYILNYFWSYYIQNKKANPQNKVSDCCLFFGVGFSIEYFLNIKILFLALLNFYYSKILQMKSSSYSSHPPVPMLNLSILQTSARPQKLKIRLHTRSSLTNMLQLPQILQQPTQRIQTDRSQCSLLSSRNHSTLSVLSEVDEEQCKQRYLSDPFFRKKMQYEAKALGRSSTNANLHKGKDCWIGIQIQKTTKLIELSNDTTFRKVKQNERSDMLQEKKKYDNFLWQVKGEASQKRRQIIR